MNKDEHLEEQERLYQEANEKRILDDAAALVRQGYERPDAVKKARDINQAQQDALNDPTGVLETLAEARSPEAPTDNVPKTIAIAASLKDQFGDAD